MLTPACPSDQALPQASACIEQPRRLTDFDRAQLAMRRDRAAAAAHGASMLFNSEVFHELTPIGRAKARAYVQTLQDEAAVLKEESLIAERTASAERTATQLRQLADARRHLPAAETRLFDQRTA